MAPRGGERAADGQPVIHGLAAQRGRRAEREHLLHAGVHARGLVAAGRGEAGGETSTCTVAVEVSSPSVAESSKT